MSLSLHFFCACVFAFYEQQVDLVKKSVHEAIENLSLFPGTMAKVINSQRQVSDNIVIILKEKFLIIS